MNTQFAKLANDAAAVATSGRWDALSARIKFLAQNRGAGNDWWVQLVGGLCCQTFSEYLALKRAYQKEQNGDAALLAWRARNLLELYVWATYCAKGRENARRLYEDSERDARDVYNTFIKWGTTNAQDVAGLKPIERVKQNLSQRALSDGIELLEGPHKRVSAAAVECGIGEQFSRSYKMLSEFAHPTAMQIVAAPDEAREVFQREFFYGEGCLFFCSAFNALERQLPAQMPTIRSGKVIVNQYGLQREGGGAAGVAQAEWRSAAGCRDEAEITVHG